MFQHWLQKFGRRLYKGIGLPSSAVRIGERVILVEVVILYEVSLKRPGERLFDH